MSGAEATAGLSGGLQAAQVAGAGAAAVQARRRVLVARDVTLCSADHRPAGGVTSSMPRPSGEGEGYGTHEYGAGGCNQQFIMLPSFTGTVYIAREPVRIQLIATHSLRTLQHSHHDGQNLIAQADV